jgi:hypothetical protein
MTELTELLWFHPKAAPRVLRHAEFRRIVEDDRARRDRSGTRDLLLPAATSPEDRADVLAVLSRGDPVEHAAVDAAVAAGSSSDGHFSPPGLLLSGELTIALDELERLRGLAANATAFAAGDETLRAAIDATHEYTTMPGLIPTPFALEMQGRRLREAFASKPRGVPADFLDTETERALLEQRRYQTCSFLGEPHLRAVLALRNATKPLLARLPAEVSPWLPLQIRLSVRALVEVHLNTDQYDRQPLTLQILGLARRVPGPRVEDGQ